MEEDNLSQSNVTPITSEMITPTTPQGRAILIFDYSKWKKECNILFCFFFVFVFVTDIGVSGDMLLEKILEEDSIYGDDRARDNLSPIGGNDTKYLLGNGHTINITRI